MSLKLYKSYNFTDKDPIIDVMRTLVEKSGMSWDEIAEKSGVSKTTLYGWFQGKTMRPQFATVMAVLTTLGVDFKTFSKQIKTVADSRKKGR
jgi:DNA-binding phage protein